MRNEAKLDEARRFYARQMAAASRSHDPRLEQVFERVRREAFLPPGPWQVMVSDRFVETPSADPIHLYQNILVALDAAKGINNGEPFLHAAWIGAVSPQPGEVICQVGTGTGYYTAMLSLLVQPGGSVHAFEIEPDLAAAARQNLAPYTGVTVIEGDATKLAMPASDLIYINAGVVAPPLAWLKALRPDGRMIFPWRPADDIGLTVVLTEAGQGFSGKILMSAWFIPCVGASNSNVCIRAPTSSEARSVHSAWLTADRQPDDTAVAIYDDMWFSSARLPERDDRG